MSARRKSNAGPGEGNLLETTITQINRQFGDGAIMRLGQRDVLHVPVIPTGALTLDLAVGVGGVPRGRITEIYGAESSGKTTIALHIAAEAQKLGGTAAFIDVEHALDPVYARKVGVNIDELLVSQPSTGEEALEIVDLLVKSGSVDVVVIDSVAALTPKAELEGEMGDSHIGLQARLMSQALRKLTGSISKSMTSVIFINQIRMKVGVMFGNPETTTGGNALKFYSSLRLEVRRGERLTRGNELIGSVCKVKVAKNKLAPPFKVAEFDILYGRGISRESCILTLGVEKGVITKTSTWYSYGDVRLGQGKDNARTFLENNPELCAEIEARILEESELVRNVISRNGASAKKGGESE